MLLFLFMCLLMSANYSQYDDSAQTYSEVFVEQNQESINTYFRFLDLDLQGKKVLDLGCGDGYDLSRLKQKGALISGIDSSKEMVKLAQAKNPGAEIQTGTFDALPFADNSFDLVISKWVFQNSETIDPIYQEVVRVLKPGGNFIYLTSHPIRQFLEKKQHPKDYFKKESVVSVFFEGKVTEVAPSHSLNEYFTPFFFSNFTLRAFEEGYDSGAEKVDGDVFPSFFVIRAMKKSKPIQSTFSEEVHESVENSYIVNSDHSDQLVSFFESKILPQISCKKSFLDIGAGPGDITDRIARHFDQTTIIEPDPLFAQSLRVKGYDLYQAHFQDVSGLSGFDFVLCSHSLYYVPHEDWPACLKKMKSALTPTGKALLLIMGARGHWHDLCHSINPRYSNGELVKRNLKNLQIPYNVTSYAALLKSSDFEKVRELVRLYTICDCFTPEQYEGLSEGEKAAIDVKIDRFIDSCKKTDGNYLIYFDTDYILF